MAITTYRCEVDLYRNGSVFRDSSNRLYDRNTRGVYLVGARNPKEAKKLLQKAIKFGSITVPKRCLEGRVPYDAPKLKHGEIVKIECDYKKVGDTTVIGRKYVKDFATATDPVLQEA